MNNQTMKKKFMIICSNNAHYILYGLFNCAVCVDICLVQQLYILFLHYGTSKCEKYFTHI